VESEVKEGLDVEIEGEEEYDYGKVGVEVERVEARGVPEEPEEGELRPSGFGV
jgi:hypothetical protein